MRKICCVVVLMNMLAVPCFALGFKISQDFSFYDANSAKIMDVSCTDLLGDPFVQVTAATKNPVTGIMTNAEKMKIVYTDATGTKQAVEFDLRQSNCHFNN